MLNLTKQSPVAMLSLPMMATGHNPFFAATRFQANAFKGMMRYQIETLSFLTHRYEQDVKLADDLLASDEFNDAFDVLGNFMQNATSDYAAEAGKIATIGAKLASETAKRLRKEAEATIEAIAARTVA
ncbi:phasin family protein [Allomesorhizobium alhagi]|uniref:Phasin domain-containing protein n=1 Tax=Mesorhizobium alhagi CCNWXJ12-2 TaxID=1107882 RepID=H0I196_9HYPH|nr:phasin family protein [Mesorhizobium alhagi]EHK53258.1 hypothetical protein MAXJ12_31167 [Mesorhizobium alhagi CCNWXJ12-2]